MKTRSAVLLLMMMSTLISRAQNPGSPRDADHPPANPSQTESSPTNVSAGRALFLKNCAHCHGVDARGDEGPDLHNLDVSDQWIKNRILKGKPEEMTAFAGKLQSPEIESIIGYLRTLK